MWMQDTNEMQIENRCKQRRKGTKIQTKEESSIEKGERKELEGKKEVLKMKDRINES